jgi:hypothetical protein
MQAGESSHRRRPTWLAAAKLGRRRKSEVGEKEGRQSLIRLRPHTETTKTAGLLKDNRRIGRSIHLSFLSFIPPSRNSSWSPPAFSGSLVLVCSAFWICFACGQDAYPHSTSGANREVKKAVEAYWAGKISADELTKTASEVKASNWTSIKGKGVDYVPRYLHGCSHHAVTAIDPWTSTSAANSRCMIMSWIIRLPSMSSPPATSARASHLWMFTLLWAAVVRPMVSMSPPRR